MIFTGIGVGGAEDLRLTVSSMEIFILLLITILIFLFGYLFYVKTRRIKGIFLFPKLSVNTKKFNSFFLIIVLANIIFLLSTGVGVVGGSATSSYSWIFSALSIEQLFPFYYLLCREDKGKLFWGNVILFSLFRILQGWTSFLLTIAIFEMFFFFKRHKLSKLTQISIIFNLPLLFILIGGKVYQYAYVLKNQIRYDITFYLSYIDGTIKFVERISNFPMAVTAYQNLNLIKVLYLSETLPIKEVLSIFRPLIPSFLMSYKEFRPINNVVVQSIYSTVSEATSTGIGLPMYITSLFYTDLASGLIWLFLIFFLFITIRSIMLSVERYPGQLDILYFLLILSVISNGSIEMVFSYGYIKLIYFIPFLLFFKVIKRKFS